MNYLFGTAFTCVAPATQVADSSRQFVCTVAPLTATLSLHMNPSASFVDRGECSTNTAARAARGFRAGKTFCKKPCFKPDLFSKHAELCMHIGCRDISTCIANQLQAAEFSLSRCVRSIREEVASQISCKQESSLSHVSVRSLSVSGRNLRRGMAPPPCIRSMGTRPTLLAESSYLSRSCCNWKSLLTLTMQTLYGNQWSGRHINNAHCNAQPRKEYGEAT
jgi:hypothetical protein